MNNPIPYDSAADTLDHIRRVQELWKIIDRVMDWRLKIHDDSKLKEPEKSAFDKYTPLLKMLTYGTPEYKEALAMLGPALDHHYRYNSHHPEHFKKQVCIICFKEFPPEWTENCDQCGNGLFSKEGFDIGGMTLLDLVELFCDWKAATERMKDGGDMAKSIQINKERFKISDQLARILENTRVQLHW